TRDAADRRAWRRGAAPRDAALEGPRPRRIRLRRVLLAADDRPRVVALPAAARPRAVRDRRCDRLLAAQPRAARAGRFAATAARRGAARGNAAATTCKLTNDRGASMSRFHPTDASPRRIL